MPDRPAIYFIDGGFKRLVPAPETFNNLFRDWKNIVTHLPLDDIPDGPELNSGAVLVRASDGDAVYLVDRGMKRAVTGASVMERYHFDEKKIAVVPPILLELLPTGKPLALPVTGA
jgi:hypothetical protein